MNFNPSSLLSADYLPYVLPGLIVLATALIVVLLMLNKKADLNARRPPRVKGKKKPTDDLSDMSHSDRRTSIRREGPPVEVMVMSPGFKAGSNNGYVLDRSTGGLRLALGAGMSPGSSLQVRAKNAPENTPWVTVIVRSCKNTGDHFELGCEFDKTPPWNVLLLFG